MEIEDITIDGKKGGDISLFKLLGDNKIKDITGYVSMEFGDPTFKLSKIILENGENIWIEGEHDFPYITNLPEQLNEDVLRNLYDKMHES